MKMGLHRKATATVASIIVIGALFFALPSHRVSAAAQGSNIITTPIFVDLTANPGTTATTTLQVENNSSNPVTLHLHTEEFKAKGTDGEAKVYVPPASDPSTSWVHYSQNDFIAQPGVWYQIKMTVKLPVTASYGYYYAVLVSPKVSQAATAGSNNAIHASNAIFVLLNANTKGEIRKLSISSYTASKRLYDYLPANFTVQVHNPGNTFIAPEGAIYISRSPGGKSIDALTINPAGNNVLPNSDRDFSAQWTDGFPAYQTKRLNGQVLSDSKGVPEQQLVWNFSSPLSKFRFGKYYAHLTLIYDNGVTNMPINAVVSFWVIPWPLIIEVLLGLIILIVCWKFSKRLVKKLWAKLFNKSGNTIRPQ